MLSCPVCLLPNFKDVNTLRSTLINVATSELHCPVCNEALMGLDKLTIHLFTHIENENNKKPNINNVNHISEEKIVQNQLLLQNENAEQNAEQSLLICEFCNFTFSDRFIYDMHQKLLHQSVVNEESGSLNYHCHLCSKKFKMKGSLMVHLRVAHYGFPNMKYNKRDNQELTSLPNSSSKISDIKQWECEICSKVFTTKYFLKKHKRLHTGEMPYCCTQCNKSFTFQQTYYKHMLYHSSEKPHSCTECGRSFKELSTLQNHARIHSGEKPFICENCGKRFRQKVSYLVHKRIHTGVMPYKCEQCEKSFRYKVSLRSHKCPKTKDAIQNMEFNDNNQNGNNNVRCILSLENDGSISLIRKDGISLLETSMEQDVVSNINLNGQSIDKNMVAETSVTPDLYSMILSPLLPEVESLKLTNSPMDNNSENVNVLEQENPSYF